MNFIVIPEEIYLQQKNDISEIKQFLQNQNAQSDLNKWITKQEARSKLKVCQKTLDNYLKKGTLPFTQFGAKILIKNSDVEAHLQKHYINKQS